MKKVIVINITIIALYFLINICFLLWKNDYITLNYPGEFQKFSLSKPIDIVNTGTSHGSVSFDWKSNENINGLNLGRSGQSFKYDLFLLDFYYNKIKESVIIIPVSFHSFCIENSELPSIDSLFVNRLPFLGMVQTSNSLRLLLNYKNDFAFYDDSFEDYHKMQPHISSEECDHDVLKSNIKTLQEIIIKYPSVILITTPYYLPSLMPIEEFEEFYSTINLLQRKYDIKYYDYSRDDRFNNHKYFYNSTHLNSEGRRLFTNIIIEELYSGLKVE